VVFVVAGAKQSGKSTVAALFGHRLGVEYVESSAVINERIEKERGLPRGTIAAARAQHHDNWRAEQIAVGNAMSAAGEPPGLLCVRRGYRVIDGIRRGKELRLSVEAARAAGRVPLVVFVDRPGGQGAADNTEGPALRAQADAMIINDSTMAALAEPVDTLLRGYRP
jgi:hypothetical protein